MEKLFRIIAKKGIFADYHSGLTKDQVDRKCKALKKQGWSVSIEEQNQNKSNFSTKTFA